MKFPPQSVRGLPNAACLKRILCDRLDLHKRVWEWENSVMRKTTIKPGPIDPQQDAQEEWLDLEHFASVEVTSEDPNFPVESSLASREGPGCLAVEKGMQVIRLIFDNPRTLHRIKLVFSSSMMRAHYSMLAYAPASPKRSEENSLNIWRPIVETR